MQFFHLARLLSLTFIWLSLQISGSLASELSDLESLAKQGNQAAQVAAGQALFTGSMGEANYKKAISYLKPAAEADHPVAKRLLGLAYMEGKGVTKDEKFGIKLLNEAAKLKDAQAQYYLGHALHKGIGIDANLITAYIWLSLASEAPNPHQTDAQEEVSRIKRILAPGQIEQANAILASLKHLYLQQKTEQPNDIQ
ncbi:tetratricopeptide repeat protein [Zooshikella ganghwensis]|uniref:tetratricopeptide repeat protein n=1 Tax=Zooshikella ganghwensis TaxID=202772 RepID=UPI00041D145B|nr:tetratricopeptide repeat protein [Zooshikella ganghwensis]